MARFGGAVSRLPKSSKSPATRSLRLGGVFGHGLGLIEVRGEELRQLAPGLAAEHPLGAEGNGTAGLADLFQPLEQEGGVDQLFLIQEHLDVNRHVARIALFLADELFHLLAALGPLVAAIVKAGQRVAVAGPGIYSAVADEVFQYLDRIGIAGGSRIGGQDAGFDALVLARGRGRIEVFLDQRHRLLELGKLALGEQQIGLQAASPHAVGFADVHRSAQELIDERDGAIAFVVANVEFGQHEHELRPVRLALECFFIACAGLFTVANGLKHIGQRERGDLAGKHLFRLGGGAARLVHLIVGREEQHQFDAAVGRRGGDLDSLAQ